MRLCKQFGLLLTAVMLLLFLSGVSAGAESEDKYYDDSGELTTKNNAVVTISWMVSNNTINVSTKAEWDPYQLCYRVTSVTDIEQCNPTVHINIENKSTTYYCETLLTITPANHFSLSVNTPVTFNRNEVKMDNNGTIQVAENYVPLSDLARVDTITVLRKNSTGVVTVGPWYTAVQRPYCETYYSNSENDIGRSQLVMTIDTSISNDDMFAYVTDPENAPGTAGAASIKIADVTITLEMVDIPSQFIVPKKTD